jgi:hypothetical protein
MKPIKQDTMIMMALIGLAAIIITLAVAAAVFNSVIDTIDKSACRDSGGSVFSVQGRSDWRCIHPGSDRWLTP